MYAFLLGVLKIRGQRQCDVLGFLIRGGVRTRAGINSWAVNQVWLLDCAIPDSQTQSASDPCWPPDEARAPNIQLTLLLQTARLSGLHISGRPGL